MTLAQKADWIAEQAIIGLNRASAEFWAKAEVENRANRLAPNLTAQEATEGLRQLARKKRPEKTPDQAA